MGWARAVGETLQEYRHRLGRSAALSGDSLGRLVRLAGSAAYSEAEPRPEDVQDAQRAAEQTLSDLRRGTPLARRLLGWYLPEGWYRN